MKKEMLLGVGAHEPIYHRMRTGNSTSEEWADWERETSEENLNILEDLGVSTIHIATTKGFGLEYEKPLIERAAKFAEDAAKRGMQVSAYVQGFPVYYETFLLETPEAVNWLAKDQKGDFIPWGGHTFRRWMDPTREEFLEYQFKLFDYILERFHPSAFGIDNTRLAPFYTDSGTNSFRNYLRNKFSEERAFEEFGLKSFDAIELPHFDSVYYPRDAYQIIKDPILQEWCYWRSHITSDFCRKLKMHINKTDPNGKLASASGCEGLRYNHLFTTGCKFQDYIDALDSTSMEESAWRPGVFEAGREENSSSIMDERHSNDVLQKELTAIRISTDCRFMKILSESGMDSHRTFWGENDRASKIIALSHAMAFAHNGNVIGTVGPLAAHPDMTKDIQDVIDWGNNHINLLTDRDSRYAPTAVWRGESTTAFIRHRSLWEACVIEQTLIENSIPFTILLDKGLETFMKNRKVLILPGTECVSQKQVNLITEFVENGGKLLLLGKSGTRDERTRVRKKYAFEHLFGKSFPDLTLIGPPHWVPTLDWGKMPETISSKYGKGEVTMIKSIQEKHPLDLTRDPYMPERQVMVKDIIPPKNEAQILKAFYNLMGEELVKVDTMQWTISEFWVQGKNLTICCVNLNQEKDGGPVTVNFGKLEVESVKMHTLLEEEPRELKTVAQKVSVQSCKSLLIFEVILKNGFSLNL